MNLKVDLIGICLQKKQNEPVLREGLELLLVIKYSCYKNSAK